MCLAVAEPERQTGVACQDAHFRLDFSEPVSGVNTTSVSLSAGASIQNIVALSGSVFEVQTTVLLICCLSTLKQRTGERTSC